MIVWPTPPTCFALLTLCALFEAGCGGEDASAKVMVGLTTDMAVGFDIDYVETTTKVDGVAQEVARLSYGEGSLLLPTARVIEPVDDGARVGVSIAAFREGEASPVVSRWAETRAESGRALLLPVSLDQACAGVSCAADATCAGGACVSPFLSASALLDYDQKWIVTARDACKSPSSGDPAIVIGQGQSAFAPLADNEVVPIEAGAQGGHHVWLALRVAGLRQMGSVVTVRGNFPDLAFDLLPFSSVVTLHKIAEHHCEIDGIRFQVDRGIPVDSVRGQALDIEVTLEDPNGDVATAVTRVVITP